MALGMCFGAAMATALHFNVGIGLALGMMASLAIGSGMEKNEGEKAEAAEEDGDEER